jgi:nucleotide-binding universal stress UspA family protein
MIALNKILVATDFSECSDAAMQHGLELARAFGAALHLLHVVEDPSITPWVGDGFPISLVEVLEHFQDESRKRLLSSVPMADLGRIVISCPFATPVQEILRCAERESVDLIVMGTHGRSLVAHALVGSVAERVVRRAPCPVLTVRESQHGFPSLAIRSTASVPA